MEQWQRIKLGEPAHRAIVNLDGECPLCGATPDNEPPFDIGREDGVLFGCRCECGFSF